MTQQANFPTTPDTAVCARCGEQKGDHIDDELFCMPVTAQTFSDDPFEPMPDDAIAMLAGRFGALSLDGVAAEWRAKNNHDPQPGE